MPYGVLIVTGAMSHQEGYASGFQQDRRCNLIAVTDEKDVDERRARLNQKMADQLNIPYIRDLDAALARPDVNVVSVCTEHHRQGRVAIRCAEASKHIYIDKPMAGSLQEARQLEAIVRKKNLRSQMFTQVLMPPAQRVKRLVASGALGELRAVHHDLHFAKGYAKDLPLKPRTEMSEPKMFLVPDAKREMFNIAVYSLAIFRWLTRRDFKTVSAVTVIGGRQHLRERLRRPARPRRVRHARPELDTPLVRRPGRPQEVVEPVDGVVEEVLIGLAHPDAQLAAQLRPERLPAGRQDAAQ